MLQIALFAQKSLFAPKGHFGLKCILGPKSDFGVKSAFLRFGPKWLHLSFVLKVFGAKCKRGGFYVKISKNVKMCEKRFPTTHNSENFTEFSQNSHFRHVGFYYSGAEKSVPFWTLFAGEHFGAKNAFWAQKCILGPKMRFWAQKCILGSFLPPGRRCL